ncbi:MAG: peptidylprolyl isomerase [Sedimentisphaerales bacterium]
MNIKNLIRLTTICIAAIWFCGCEETARKPDVSETRLAAVKPPEKQGKMPAPAGGLVLSIESTAITSDELIAPVKSELDNFAAGGDYELFRKKARPLLADVLLQKITDIKLYEKAKAALPENVDNDIIDKIVEQEVQKFIAHCGGNYAVAEQILKKMGLTWPEFYKQQRRTILVQSFLSDEMKIEKPITYSELVQYYNSIKNESYAKDAMFEFRLIDLNTEKFADPNDPNSKGDQKAIELANQLEQKIKNGEDFAKLAEKYSNDESAKNGGLWKPARPGSLVEPYNKIETVVVDMNAGDVSVPVFARNHIFIVKLENKQAEAIEPFEKVQAEVETRYILERRQKMVNDIINKIISQVDLSYADNFIEFCIEQAWRSARK